MARPPTSPPRDKQKPRPPAPPPLKARPEDTYDISTAPVPKPGPTRVAERDIRALLAVAEWHQDCGPPGEGRKSDELKKLIARVAKALARQVRARERQKMEEYEARIQRKIDLEIQMEGD